MRGRARAKRCVCIGAGHRASLPTGGRPHPRARVSAFTNSHARTVLWRASRDGRTRKNKAWEKVRPGCGWWGGVWRGLRPGSGIGLWRHAGAGRARPAAESRGAGDAGRRRVAGARLRGRRGAVGRVTAAAGYGARPRHPGPRCQRGGAARGQHGADRRTIVTLTLSAGCPTRITRTLVLLADPPLVMPTMQAAPVAAAAAAAPAPAPGATPPAAPGTGATATTPRAPTTASAPRATRPPTPPRATRTAAPRAAPPSASRAAVAQAPSAAAAPSPAPSAPKTEPPAAEGRPRLQLDAPQVSLSQAAAQAAEAQASAAQAKASEAEAAALAAQQRMRDMEAELTRIRAEAKAQTDALLALRQQIAQDQSQRQQTWLVPLLLAATAVFAGVALWLAMRSKQQRPPPQRMCGGSTGRPRWPLPATTIPHSAPRPCGRRRACHCRSRRRPPRWWRNSGPAARWVWTR